MNVSESTISTISTKNKNILNFYNEHPDIDFDDSVLAMINMLKLGINKKPTYYQKHETNEILNDPIFLQKSMLNIDNYENHDLEIILNKNYPTSNITRNMMPNLFYDFMLVRENKQKLIISSK